MPILQHYLKSAATTHTRGDTMLDTSKPETEEKDSGATAWNRIVGVSLAMPGAKVDRESFLRSQLMGYCDEEQIAKAD